MRTDDILDQIDGALRDTTVSPDAMRCNAPDIATTRRVPQPSPIHVPALKVGGRRPAPPPRRITVREHLTEARAGIEITALALTSAARKASGDARRYILDRWTGVR